MSLLSSSLKRMNKKLDRQRSRQECGSFVEEDLWFASPRASNVNANTYDDDDHLGAAATARLLHRALPTMEARNPSQQRFMNLLAEKSIHVLLAAGAAGTGKTALSIYAAVRALCNGSVNKIILTRPAVSAGEELGFLPGDMQSKLDPFLRPLFDVLYKFWSVKEVQKLMENQTIEICPIAFARGRTFCDSFIVVDEVQNCTRSQLMMMMTRIGSGSKMVLVGDPDQHDRLPGNQASGFVDFLDRHERAIRTSGRLLDGIRVFRFKPSDVVRHPVVQTILRLYAPEDDALAPSELVPEPEPTNDATETICAPELNVCNE